MAKRFICLRNQRKNMLNKLIGFPFLKIFLIILASSMISNIFAEEIYQKPEDFIKDSFSSKPPKSKVLWITKSLKPEIYKIMGHDLTALRIRYWSKEDKTVWVLNEIGKEHPITVGLIVSKNKIQKLKVLVFRESRGGEIRHSFFTKQFKQIGLTSDNKLEKNIDGISGATLSVTALKKLARLALYFDLQIKN